jgi:hypothetical protein
MTENRSEDRIGSLPPGRGVACDIALGLLDSVSFACIYGRGPQLDLINLRGHGSTPKSRL